MKRITDKGREFLKSIFPMSQPPEGFTVIKGADLKVGMVISLSDRPELEAATGKIYLLQPSGSRWNDRGETAPERFFVHVETMVDGVVRDPVFEVYWDDEVCVKSQEV